MEKVYIVTAHDAIEAVQKVQAMRAKETKDAPFMEPTPKNLSAFVSEYQSLFGALTAAAFKANPKAYISDAKSAIDSMAAAFNGNMLEMGDDLRKWHTRPLEEYKDVEKAYRDVLAAGSKAESVISGLRSSDKDIADDLRDLDASYAYQLDPSEKASAAGKLEAQIADVADKHGRHGDWSKPASDNPFYKKADRK